MEAGGEVVLNYRQAGWGRDWILLQAL